jgi:hypothetical protein
MRPVPQHSMVERIASLRARINDLEGRILSISQQDIDNKSPSFKLAIEWLEEAKTELRDEEREDQRLKRRRDEQLFQLELQIKKKKLEGIWFCLDVENNSQPRFFFSAS